MHSIPLCLIAILLAGCQTEPPGESVRSKDKSSPFAMFDASGDQRISLDEWQAEFARSINITGLSANDGRTFVENSIQIFKAADRNGDGFLSSAEYDGISGLQVGPQKIEEILRR